jgi:hypothetical protein
MKYSINRWVHNSATNGYYKVYDPYTYNEHLGYMERVKNFIYNEWEIKYKPAEDFGCISESPSRLIAHFVNGTAKIENLQKGILRFHTTSFDTKGYISQLFPEEILATTQFLDKIKFSSSSLKDVTEQKSQEHEPNILNEIILPTNLDELGLMGINNENS